MCVCVCGLHIKGTIGLLGQYLYFFLNLLMLEIISQRSHISSRINRIIAMKPSPVPWGRVGSAASDLPPYPILLLLWHLTRLRGDLSVYACVCLSHWAPCSSGPGITAHLSSWVRQSLPALRNRFWECQTDKCLDRAAKSLKTAFRWCSHANNKQNLLSVTLLLCVAFNISWALPMSRHCPRLITRFILLNPLHKA